MAESLSEQDGGDVVSLSVECVEDLGRTHGGQKARYLVRDIDGESIDLAVFRNSPVAKTSLEVGEWYELKEVRYHIKDGHSELRAIGQSQVDNLDEPPQMNTSPDGSEETAPPIWKYLCGQGSCQECFSRGLFGGWNTREVEEGDLLVLYDFSDELIFGPFIATSDAERKIEPEAWNGRFPEQVKVTWDSLYRVPESEFPFDVTEEGQDREYRDRWDPSQTADILRYLREEGQPVRVTDDGSIEEPVTKDEEQDDSEESDTEDRDDRQDDESNPFETVPDEDPEDAVRDILRLAEDPTVDPVETLEEADEPGERLIQAAIDGEIRPEIYRQALSHITAGKNVVFFGPPGSGKTRTASRLAGAICGDLHIETAHAEWTHQKVVGGYRPDGDSFTEQPGLFTKAVTACQESLQESGRPDWLIIDELNRANLDEAFGEIFTLLDLDHRAESRLRYGDRSTEVPISFRVLATMNTKDRAQLFSLGYAFMRRFAFVNVPSLLQVSETVGTDGDVSPPGDAGELAEGVRQSRLVIERAVIRSFQVDSSIEGDTVLGVPYLDALFDPELELDTAVEEICGVEGQPDFIDAVLEFVQILNENDIVEIGQGLVIDAVRFVVTHRFLFPDQADWSTVDDAVGAYILPQLEEFMSTLRRAETLGDDESAQTRFDCVLEAAERLHLQKTAARLQEATETNRILG